MTKKKRRKKKKGYKYCRAHDFHYMDFLSRCPLCVGELYGEMNAAGLNYCLLKTPIKRKKNGKG